MAVLTDLYIKKETLETILNTLNKKSGKESKGVFITISISDDVNDYDQNVSAHISQSKEQREAKAKKFYIGNGKVIWTDGKVVKPEKKEEPKSDAYTFDDDSDLLPF